LSLEFLLEIGCEEIPARFVPGASSRLAQLIATSLLQERLEASEVKSFCTLRRLVAVVERLSERQSDRMETIVGPPISAAIDSQNNPTKAAEGFARKHGLSFSDLSRIKTEKGEYLGFDKSTPGRFSREILSELIPLWLKNLDFPKNMIWESSEFHFVRPIRWIIALLNGESLSVQIADIQSAHHSFGHRILTSNHKFNVNNYQEYKELLLNNNVIYDPSERKGIISSELLSKAEGIQASLISDEALLETVTYLNEYPSVICGQFDSSFLDVPREVLITVMREHQKYFSLQDSKGNLLPNFLAVVDSKPEHHKLIIAGHERVLKARLADARFFWNVDNQHPLIERRDALKGIVFQAKLGSMHDKSLRIAKLGRVIASIIKRKDLIPVLNQAASLCKVDLTTDMVREFTDLQGIMGGLYCKKQGLPFEVAEAIYDHYRPVSLEDQAPRSIAGAILSIADKIDSIVGACSIGQMPTGSGDPFAIRRQTQGIIKVILEHSLRISLEIIANSAYINYRKTAEISWKEIWVQLEPFVKDRLKYVFKEQGFNYDEINAAVEAGMDDPNDCHHRLQALAQMRGSDDFRSLATSFKRIKNIIVKAGLTADSEFSIRPELLQEVEEKGLHAAIVKIAPRIFRMRKKNEFKTIFELMASLRPEVDLFFDKVLVMAEDPEIQKNRLSLLGYLWKLFLGVADISEMVVS
jgi:glycyl-tRNA synthetase beta chain